jgi:RNA polymerase sigma-70 factor (ECF subfamily)
MNTRDEGALIDRSLAGDSQAFGELVDCYGPPVFNLALRMLNDPEDARDVSQVAFVKAYQHLHTFDRRNRFFSWIYRIALNESLNLLSRRRRHEALDETLVSGDRTPETTYEATEENGLVTRGLMELSVEHRQVIVLRHFMEMSHREIGSVLHLPEKTVKSRLHTARGRLGEILRRWGCGPS